MKQNQPENSKLEKELEGLSNTQLLAKTFDLAKKEQQTTLSLLFHLKEVNERRSYALLGCSSLWEYTVKILGYGESGASERINAMRLLTQVPELKEKLEAGKMTLTTASQVQRFFQSERKILKKNYSASQKLEVLSQLEGCSKREVEQRLVALSPEQVTLPPQVEKTRILPENKTELKFIADRETTEMIKRVREIKSSECSLSEIFKQALKSWLSQNDPEKRYLKKLKKNDQDLESKTADATESLVRKTDEAIETFTIERQEFKNPQAWGEENETSRQSFARQNERKLNAKNNSVESARQTPQKPSRYISIGVRRKIYARAKGQCEYKSFLNGKRCESKTRLQWEHIHPHALGGSNSVDNIALLCFSHNQRRAVEIFGTRRNLSN